MLAMDACGSGTATFRMGPCARILLVGDAIDCADFRFKCKIAKMGNLQPEIPILVKVKTAIETNSSFDDGSPEKHGVNWDVIIREQANGIEFTGKNQFFHARVVNAAN